MAVTLTEAAARHVSRYIGRRGKGVGVRLGVKTTGGSGMAYKLEYADEVAPEDVVFEAIHRLGRLASDGVDEGADVAVGMCLGDLAGDGVDELVVPVGELLLLVGIRTRVHGPAVRATAQVRDVVHAE